MSCKAFARLWQKFLESAHKANNYQSSEINEARMDLVKFTEDCAVWLVEIAYYFRSNS